MKSLDSAIQASMRRVCSDNDDLDNKLIASRAIQRGKGRDREREREQVKFKQR